VGAAKGLVSAAIKKIKEGPGAKPAPLPLEMQCVLTGVSNIKFDRFTASGGVRGVTCDLSLQEFQPFKLDDKPTDTRYHRARRREYMELLAVREYGDPMIGDIIRKLHPTSQVLEIGDVVKLPSAEKLATNTVEPKSTALKGIFNRKPSPQKTLFQDTMEAKSKVAFYSLLR
jgi:hypothetical protein